jgi:molybdopterin-containing oxidoreductase family iron-sulfur binding subunit
MPSMTNSRAHQGTDQPMKGPMLTRRNALQVFAAHMALSLAACGKPDEQVLPYVRMPEGLVPGEPKRFATTLPLSGFGRGVLAVSVDGRPIKIEGNPSHPASLGATDPFLEASVLSLYDPDRSQTVTETGRIASWPAFHKALSQQMQTHRADRGRGLRLLTGRVTSPTLLRQIAVLLQQFPEAVWHVHEPLDDAAASEGARLVFGRPLCALPQFEKARVVLALDADPLGPGPDQLRNARGWAKLRGSAVGDNFSRLYALESRSTLTGAKADQRVALHPDQIAGVAIAIANRLGAGRDDSVLPPQLAPHVETIWRDLDRTRGGALLLAGPSLPADIHALVHWINARLEAPITLVPPAGSLDDVEAQSLAALVDAANADAVSSLMVIDSNPVYDAPPALQVDQALHRIPFSFHLGLYKDETGNACRWHAPLSHPLESWSDLRATDGTASIVQPLIAPLYDTTTAHEMLARLVGSTDTSAYDLVRQTWVAEWSAQAGGDFDVNWRKSQRDGVIPESASRPITLAQPSLPATAHRDAPPGLTLVLHPDPAVWDGSFANNPWLQECPRPISKQVWGNALAIGKADAERLSLKSGDVVKLAAGGRTIETPVRIDSGVATGVVALSLGYGRSAAGQIGDGVGANGYALIGQQGSLRVDGVALQATGRHEDVLTTQNDVKLDGDTRELYHLLTLPELRKLPLQLVAEADTRPTLLPNYDYDTYAWGMAIDTSVCIGCNACVVSCQAENNVPVVGPEEISRGRDMHWLRVDFYHDDSDQHGGFQPVPCMHCEKAPCEPVCPVAASVHDGEGLNLQVYNRCVGTRFCEANCPYKVRRFNFFGYADGQEYASLGSESFKAQRNPDVTVRARGVMEKCTYCIQRISGARRDAEKAGRRIGDGEVVTACQSACPTQAISFGNLNDGRSEVNKRKAQPHHYELLGHLDTRPRTTYLADLRNPPPPDRDRGQG